MLSKRIWKQFSRELNYLPVWVNLYWEGGIDNELP